MVRFTRSAAWATCSALAMPCAAPAASAAGMTTPNTATPIKHLVVIFQENVSFDRKPGDRPALDDVIAFLKTLTDGYTR